MMPLIIEELSRCSFRRGFANYQTIPSIIVLLSAKKSSMQMLKMSLFIGKWLRKYAVLLIILVALGWKIGGTLINGMMPVPQLPPNGYELEQGAVTLQWNKGNIEAPITLQISTTEDFEELVFEKEVTGITHRYSDNLERGQVYFWRLSQNEQLSPTSNFVVSAQHINL